MTCTKNDIQAHPWLSRPDKNRVGRIASPLSSLWLLLVPKHCILRIPKPVHIAHFTPINHTPEPLLILLLAPHTQTGAHPRMLVDTEAHERVEVVACAMGSLAVPSCLLELVPPPMRSLDVVFHRGSGGAEGSLKSASSSSSVPAPGVYCDDGVRRSPVDVNVDLELFFFESGSSGWCHANGLCENWKFDDDGDGWTERRWVRCKGW